MDYAILNEPALIGRNAELDRLSQAMDQTIAGKGMAVLISGEPGIGKTKLVTEFCARASLRGVHVLSGAAQSDSARPFHMFARALEGHIDGLLFKEQEQVSFSQVFAIDRAGMLLAKASSSESDLDADIFAGMFSAVQNFVRDSLDSSGEVTSGLGRLEYGDMKILVEYGQLLFLTAVFTGEEHPDMKNSLKSALEKMENEHSEILLKWAGRMSDLSPIQRDVEGIARQHFTVRKSLDGLKLENELLGIADRVLEALSKLANSKPLLILLEDMHWADDPSLSVFNYLARNVRDRPMLLLGTLRSGESTPLERRLDKMKREGLVTEIILERLGSDAVSGIVSAVCPGNGFPKEFIDALAERCSGTPLFLVELLKHMCAEGSVALSESTFVLVREDYAIPNTVEEVIQGRLARLSPDALALAEYASCIGREFKVDTAMSAATVKDPATALSELHSSGVLGMEGSCATFHHAMYQATIYSSISPRWKSLYHKDIGEYFENASQGRLDECIYELARHFSLTNEYAKALSYCVRAGEKAEAGYASDQAIQFYMTALSLGQHLKHAFPSEKETDLHERLGDLYTLNGDYDKALESYTKAIETTVEPAMKCRLHRKRSVTLEKMGKFDDALSEVIGAETLVGAESPEHWRNIAQKGYVMLRKGNYDRCIEFCASAAREFEKLGLEQDVSNSDNLIGMAYWYKQDFENSLRHHERSIAVKEKLKDESGLMLSFNNVGNSYDSLGQHSLAMEYYQKALAIAERRRDQHSIGMLYNNLGLVYQSMDDLGKALEFQEKSLNIRLKIGDVWGLAASYSNIAQVMRARGENARAAELFSKSNEIARKAGIMPFILGSALSIAEIYISEGRIDEAASLCDECETLATSSGAKGFIAFATHVRGKLLAARREYKEAEAKFSEAADVFESRKMVIQAANVRLDLGRMLLEKREIERGKEILRQSLKTFEDAGINTQAEKCRKALEE